MNIPKPRKYSMEQLLEKLPNSLSMRDLIKSLNLTYSTESGTSLQRRLESLELDTKHWTNEPYVKQYYTVSGTEYIRRNKPVKSATLREKLIEEGILHRKCVICGIESEWNRKPITLQLDHISGDNTDNRLENLRILCLNCHSQTPTYCRRKSGGNT